MLWEKRCATNFPGFALESGLQAGLNRGHFMSSEASVSPLRLVIKFGSGILTLPDTAALDESQFARLTQAIAILKQQGHEVIVVTSGAVAAGLGVMGFAKRPLETGQLQACAAVGQTRLMHKYATLLGACGLHVAQLLVTHEDFAHAERRGNLETTLRNLMESPGIVPVINENDSVATEELKFGDNDALSADVAVLARADMLILFTSVDGLLPPGESRRIVEEVNDIATVLSFARNEKGEYSVGGMASKLRAVEKAVSAGIATLIANGRRPEQIPDLVAGRGVATRFAPQRS
jgi:glutamate 5-kinase